MKRCFITIAAIGFASLFGSTALHAQKTYSNSKPMTFGHNLGTYYNVQKNNLTNAANAVPEDKFYATPPGYAKEHATGEQMSIGAEIAHGADAQFRMCTLILTGVNPPAASLPGTMVMKSASPTKAAMMDALAKSFQTCDPIINNFDDSKVAAMVMSQHSLQPLGTTIFNTISHDREVYGRIKSFMVNFGIKGVNEVDASDPMNPNDEYYCGGQTSKTPELCK